LGALARSFTKIIMNITKPRNASTDAKRGEGGADVFDSATTIGEHAEKRHSSNTDQSDSRPTGRPTQACAVYRRVYAQPPAD
jgi:hypothetical protein